MKPLLLRGLLMALVAILLVEWPVVATAEITNIGFTVYGQQRSAVMGEEVTYFGEGTVTYPWYVSEFFVNWRWVCDIHGPAESYQSCGYGQTWPNWTFFHSLPGTVEFEMIVWYKKYFSSDVATNTVVRQFTIARADRVTPYGGFNISQDYDEPIGTSYEIWAGDRRIGAQAAGMPRLRLTGVWQRPPLDPENPPDWPEDYWVPSGYDPTFYRTGWWINDIKSNTTGSVWQALPVGVFTSLSQHMRLDYSTPCIYCQPNPRWVYLGSVELNGIKVDDTHWKVTLE